MMTEILRVARNSEIRGEEGQVDESEVERLRQRHAKLVVENEKRHTRLRILEKKRKEGNQSALIVKQQTSEPRKLNSEVNRSHQTTMMRRYLKPSHILYSARSQQHSPEFSFRQ